MIIVRFIYEWFRDKFFRLSGRLPFTEIEPQETEARIQAAKFDLSKLYQNVSQSASLFLKKILCSYPW